MDVRATKDHYELETEETERLVRPSPKVKPPRHDKTREDVHERDSDTDGDPDLKGDPDMSVNYKNVGGSLSERVAARFAAEDAPKSKTWVRVLNKDKDHVTRVRPETLQDEPVRPANPSGLTTPRIQSHIKSGLSLVRCPFNQFVRYVLRSR
jgi:hypothetical protein